MRKIIHLSGIFLSLADFVSLAGRLLSLRCLDTGLGERNYSLFHCVNYFRAWDVGRFNDSLKFLCLPKTTLINILCIEAEGQQETIKMIVKTRLNKKWQSQSFCIRRCPLPS